MHPDWMMSGRSARQRAAAPLIARNDGLPGLYPCTYYRLSVCQRGVITEEVVAPGVASDSPG
jgi:hypothetical protein